MVRLEQTEPMSCLGVNWFQFHYGTIGTHVKQTSVNMYPVSIPLWYDWNNRRRYNSKSGAFKFQFHYGTIGTASTTLILYGLTSFNSIMVRLELFCYYLQLIKNNCFNSIMVRLEHISAIRSMFYQRRFNSIMVRLERSLGKWFMGLATVFQFHYGTIGTFWRDEFCYNYLVSIPLWYDWNSAAVSTIILSI